ncbi:hypothetical protein EDB89DRAFT_2007747 [Lactarius sanguifluus]|nr:hypothetical protein EDB89DRAFT_2007747 [Lactarius sanguifluus]
MVSIFTMEWANSAMMKSAPFLQLSLAISFQRCCIFKAGKQHDGWFGFNELLAQVDRVIDIFEGKTNGLAQSPPCSTMPPATANVHLVHPPIHKHDRDLSASPSSPSWTSYPPRTLAAATRVVRGARAIVCAETAMMASTTAPCMCKSVCPAPSRRGVRQARILRHKTWIVWPHERRRVGRGVVLDH